MPQNFKSFCKHFSGLNNQGVAFVTVTLTDIVGSAPQDLGARMIISKKGIEFGTVGGGKIENAAIEYAKAMLDSEEPESSKQSVTWNLQKDIGMTCGGKVSLLFEQMGVHSNWNITIFGAGHVSQELVRVLDRQNCKLKVIDSRQEWLDKLPQSEKIETLCLKEPASAVKDLTPGSSVVIMTMGSGTDLPIVYEILKTDTHKSLSYLGVIGSKQKRNVIETELLKKGVSKDKLKEFICPIGEDIGGNTPPEISISIVAQLLRSKS